MSGVSVRAWLELIAAAVLLATIGLTSCQLTRANKRAGASALEADTLRATVDTSKAIALRLGDQLAAVQRQAVQVGARADSIDRQLGLERIAKVTLIARIDTLRARVSSVAPVVETAAGERSAEFVVDSTPFHVKASVFMPAPPEAATLSLAVSVDSIGLEARTGCGPENAAGIRSAFVTVIGPTWAPIALRRVEQDPGLCRSSALEPEHGDGRSWFRKAVDRFGVSAGYGLKGPDVLAGFRLWP